MTGVGRRRLLPPLLAGFMLLLGSGCSVQMAYNNLDRLARWSISDYIDMTTDQRGYFDGALDELWYWHRRNHLPEYATFLESLGPRFLDGTTEAEMQAVVDQVFVWGAEVQARGMPVAAELLGSLSDAQVAELADKLEARNVEIAEPEADLTREQAQKQWSEEFADRFSQFSGRLSGVQRAYLRQRAVSYAPDLVMWADYRRRWQKDFLALLEFRQDVDGLEVGLSQLTDNRERYFSPELALADAQNVALYREVSVWLINSLTERQQARFVESLNDLADDFRTLAQQERGAPDGAPPCLMRC
ncbi:MAG: DUF6279 family lipoprotein [Pseudomonadales bacterium]